MPERIQRKRTKGYKMPPGAKYVGRPGPWGNPFVVGQDGTAEEVVALYRKYMSNTVTEEMTEWRNSYYSKWEGDKNKPSPWWGFVIVSARRLEELRGKDLACFCSLSDPCHADVLLELANGGES